MYPNRGGKVTRQNPMFKDSGFDVLDDAMENVEGGSTAEQITTAMDTLNTASINVSTAGPSNVSTVGDIFEDEMVTISDTLMAIRSARPRITSVGEARIIWMKRMDADELLAARLQEQEREQFSVDEQARFLVETIAARKKFFAAQRQQEIRKDPQQKLNSEQA
ncbi:hypothetical protein Tco_0212374 [Tanacetum coccineum]